MKARWGIWDSKACRIWLNPELVKNPVTCLEYSIVHEIYTFWNLHTAIVSGNRWTGLCRNGNSIAMN